MGAGGEGDKASIVRTARSLWVGERPSRGRGVAAGAESKGSSLGQLVRAKRVCVSGKLLGNKPGEP